MSTIYTAILLITITERVSAAILAPIKKRWPNVDLWWVLYPTWVLGGLLTYLAGINLFADIIPTLNPTVGQVLSAVVTGGGANLLHDILDRPATTTITTSSSAPDSSMSASVRTTTTSAPPPAAPHSPKDPPAGNTNLG